MKITKTLRWNKIPPAGVSYFEHKIQYMDYLACGLYNAVVADKIEVGQEAFNLIQSMPPYSSKVDIEDPTTYNNGTNPVGTTPIGKVFFNKDLESRTTRVFSGENITDVVIES